MSRRAGRLGDYLITDDNTGFTIYASEARKDYWGNYTKKPLKRNLQEVATPFNDPQPVSVYRGPGYEYFDPCDAKLSPDFIGVTNVPTPNSLGIQVLGLTPTIPNMSIGCTFIVR